MKRRVESGGIALVSSASRDVAVIDAVDDVSAGAEFIALHGGVGRDNDDYPPGWTTLPVAIFSLTDRGNIADGAALTIVLVAITLLLMMKLERIAKRLGHK